MQRYTGSPLNPEMPMLSTFLGNIPENQTYQVSLLVEKYQGERINKDFENPGKKAIPKELPKHFFSAISPNF